MGVHQGGIDKTPLMDLDVNIANVLVRIICGYILWVELLWNGLVDWRDSLGFQKVAAFVYSCTLFIVVQYSV